MVSFLFVVLFLLQFLPPICCDDGFDFVLSSENVLLLMSGSFGLGMLFTALFVYLWRGNFEELERAPATRSARETYVRVSDRAKPDSKCIIM